MSLHPFDQLTQLAHGSVQEEPSCVDQSDLSVEPGGLGGRELTASEARVAFEGLFVALVERLENTRIVEAAERSGKLRRHV